MNPNQKNQGAATEAPAPPTTPTKPASTLTDVNGRLELVNPTIEFAGYVFIDATDSRTQTKKHSPSRAYVEDGVLVIEECGIAMPMAMVALIRFGKKVST